MAAVAVQTSRLFTPVTSIIARKFKYALTTACSGTITRHRHSAPSISSTEGAAIVVPEGGRIVTAEWSSSRPPSTFHSTWLRHNCQCSVCVTSSGQKSVASTDLDPSTTVTRARLTGGNLEVCWSCGHEGSISTDWLLRHCYSAQSLHTAMEKRRPSVATSMPEMSARDLEEDKGVWRWLKYLNEFGLCLLKDASLMPGSFIQIAEKVSHLQKTIYGQEFAVVSTEDPINIAYSNVPLEPHMDLEYYESPPGLQLLCCLRNDDCVTGGESIVVDGFAVVEELRRTHPQHFFTLSRVPATFQKVHYKRDKPVHMIYQRPHITLDLNGQVSKFSWSPPFEGPLQVPEEDVQPYYEAYHCLAKMINCSQFKMIMHRFVPGEILAVNNHRMLHGRCGFELNGGIRSLQGMYINIDEFKSRFQVLSSQYAPDYTTKHVFNQDHASYR